MVSSPYRTSPGGRRDSQPGPSHTPMVAINKNAAKPSTSKSRTPWPLDTFWSSSSKKVTQSKSSRSPISPVLGASSYESSTGLDLDQNFDFGDLPLTPPDSGASAFELHPPPPATRDAQSTPASRAPLLVSTASSTTGLLQDDCDEAKSPPQKGRSKNDIFNSPISWITPPPRSVPLSASNPPPPPSRNSLFFSSFGSSSPTPPSPPPPPPRISSVRNAGAPSTSHSDLLPAAVPHPPSATATATPPAAPTSDRKKGHSRNSSLGRASSEQCLQEEARIRATKHVDFRLCPTNEFLLGEGRHCSVYLGSYRPRPDTVSPETSPYSLCSNAWQLCAIKRLHADRQSQLLGLEEAFALRRLGLHPNIIQLIDIRDEVEFASPQPTPQPRERPLLTQTAGLGLGLGLPRSEGRSSSPNGAASHSRSTSDMTGRDEILQETQTHKRNVAHEKQHEAAMARGIIHEPDQHPTSYIPQQRSRNSVQQQTQSSILPTPAPTFLVQGPDGDSLSNQSPNPSSDQSLIPRSPGLPLGTPRLLILLELLPNNLALFARKHPDRIDLRQWYDWALQMTEAILFLHTKGCVHSDIKKENMLLTDSLHIKLCDFNSAVFPNPSDPPRDGLGLGTPAYCAPELNRATGGPGATSFSYPIDVFSLGAVLYSLATGYEPFSKARSVVEMLHRKKLFFESEENDRASRLAVEAGSNAGSANASRSGSLRGRHHKQRSSEGPASPGQLASSLNRLLQHQNQPTGKAGRREASSDSLESVASSITTISGRKTSSMAVSRLLEPGEARGLLMDPSVSTRQGSLRGVAGMTGADVRRAASMGGKKGGIGGGISPSLRSAPVDHSEGTNPTAIKAEVKGSPITKVNQLELASRPDWLRRRSSYGDELTISSSNHHHHQTNANASYLNSTVVVVGENTEVVKPSRLRSMFSPTSPHFGQSNSSSSSEGTRSPPIPHPNPNPTQRETREEGNEEGEAEEDRVYADGHPPIHLPGGGRLPDWARDLLRSMLEPNPSSRPTAQQVREVLLSHSHQI